MNAMTGLVVCVFCLGAEVSKTQRGETDKQPKEEVVIGKYLDASGGVLIRGVIVFVRQEINLVYNREWFEALVTSKTEMVRSAALYYDEKADKYSAEINERLSTFPDTKPVIDKLAVNDRIPPDKIVAADFVLHLAVHGSGDIRLNDKQEVYIKQDILSYTGYAEVSYRKEFLTSYPDQTHGRSSWTCLSFAPLAKQLKCQSIWVREGLKLSVFWAGGKEGWDQEIITDEGK